MWRQRLRVPQRCAPNPSSGPGLLAAFKPYLQTRCAEGVTATSVLYAEIRARGYRGGERTLRRFLVQVRGREQQPPTAPPVASARQLTTWIMRPDD
jgi:transposase